MLTTFKYAALTWIAAQACLLLAGMIATAVFPAFAAAL